MLGRSVRGSVIRSNLHARGEQTSDGDADTDGENGSTRPAFKGCVFCYSADLTVYAAKKLGR